MSEINQLKSQSGPSGKSLNPGGARTSMGDRFLEVSTRRGLRARPKIRQIPMGFCALLRPGIFCFSSQPPARSVTISPLSQRPLSRSSSPRQGLLLVARVHIPERLEPSQLRLKERLCPSMRRGCALSAGSRYRCDDRHCPVGRSFRLSDPRSHRYRESDADGQIVASRKDYLCRASLQGGGPFSLCRSHTSRNRQLPSALLRECHHAPRSASPPSGASL